MFFLVHLSLLIYMDVWSHNKSRAQVTSRHLDSGRPLLLILTIVKLGIIVNLAVSSCLKLTHKLIVVNLLSSHVERVTPVLGSQSLKLVL